MSNTEILLTEPEAHSVETMDGGLYAVELSGIPKWIALALPWLAPANCVRVTAPRAIDAPMVVMPDVFEQSQNAQIEATFMTQMAVAAMGYSLIVNLMTEQFKNMDERELQGVIDQTGFALAPGCMAVKCIFAVPEEFIEFARVDEAQPKFGPDVSKVLKVIADAVERELDAS
jgi:hypothetical protein